MINGGERVPVICISVGERAQVDSGGPGRAGRAPQGLLRMGTGDVIPGMRALPAELRDRPGVP